MNLRALPALTFAASLTFAGILAIGALLSLLARALPGVGNSLLLAAAVEGVVYVGLSVWLARGWRAPLAELGLCSTSVELMLLGAALGVALHGPADFVEAHMERWLPLSESVFAERARRLSPDALGERALLLVAAAGLVPLVEELFFRGALLGFLRRTTSLRLAAIASGACFTLSHVEPRSWPALALVASALGWLRSASQSLLPCILLHATFNATTLAVIFAQPRAALGRSEPSWLLFAVGLAFSVALLVRARRSQPAADQGLA